MGNAGLGVFGGWQIAEAAVRADRVVIEAPDGDSLAGMTGYFSFASIGCGRAF